MASNRYCRRVGCAGLPDVLGTLLAESDVGTSKGGLSEDTRQLSALIGRPTTPLAELLRIALGL
jgi:NAD(P)H dehydrogenase (quinone)